MTTRVDRLEIREAIESGLKAYEIVELLGISHDHVTRERKYLGIGKWRRRSKPAPSNLKSLLGRQDLQPTWQPIINRDLPKVDSIKDMLLDSRHYYEIQTATGCRKDSITAVKTSLKQEGYEWNRQGKLISGKTSPSSVPTVASEHTLEGNNDMQSQSAQLTPEDYVKAFEARVLEYHETVERLEAENKQLLELTQQLRRQLRSWQPSTLVRKPITTEA